MTLDEYIELCFKIPYKERGRNLETGLDCYGFVYNYYKLCLGKNLPISVFCKEDLSNVIHKIEKPINDCLVHMRSTRGPLVEHICFYRDGYVYHFSRTGLRINKLYRCIRSIKGFYDVIAN